MSRITRGVRRALRRGGTPELVRVVRKHVAAAIDPDPRAPAVATKRPKTKAPVNAAKVTRPTQRKVPVVKPVLSSARDVDHAVALEWFETRRPTYERLVSAVAPYVDRQGTVLDVGANVGYFTKVFGEMLDFRGTVHLFEPIPHLADLCRTTLEDVPFRTTVHEFGLSDEDTSLDIYVSADGNLGWNTIVAAKATTGMRPLQIEVRAFDGTGLDGTPAFIKIDVEGAEYKVLGGMLSSIESWSPRPTILCEIGWGAGHPAWAEELEVFRRLEQLGYRTLDLEGAPVAVESLRRTTDLLFVPEHLHSS